MNKEATRYVDGIHIGMNYIQKQHNRDNKVVSTLPEWQVKYEDYGGLKVYTMIRDMYWGISSYYIDVEGRYDATNFPLTGYEEGITNLLKQFRKDLIKPIHHYD